jgi:hypothetical protein
LKEVYRSNHFDKVRNKMHGYILYGKTKSYVHKTRTCIYTASYSSLDKEIPENWTNKAFNKTAMEKNMGCWDGEVKDLETVIIYLLEAEDRHEIMESMMETVF